MDIMQILKTYDDMYGTASLEEIEAYLTEQIGVAQEKEEDGVLFTLLNEMVGFCRDTTQREKGLDYCNQLLELLEKMKLEGRVEHATSFLNIANAYRAFGLHKEALAMFEKVLANYETHLEEGDFRYASLYNNWSLLYQEMEKFVEASDMLKKALAVVELYEEALIPKATTLANLAASLLQVGTDESYQEAMDCLEQALAIYREDGERDFHYGAALVAMGDALLIKGNYAEALTYYEKGMTEVEKHTGKNENYDRVKEKAAYAKRQLLNLSTGNNMDRCRAFYELYVRQMVREKFPEQESRIAVGLVGEGSDCYGFDDEISKDHDYGVGLCFWLTEEDAVAIGEDLQKSYEELLRQVYQAGTNDRFIAQRRGVFTINGFYNGLLETKIDFETQEFSVEELFVGETVVADGMKEWNLAAAVNGQVFRDDLGTFTNVREKLLAYYPEPVWRDKLANGLHEFSQYAQSNYPRMMARGDELTASMCVSKAVESTMDLAFLLNRVYAPYYKWKKKALSGLPVGKKLIPLLERVVALPSQSDAWTKETYDSAKVNMKDEKVALFEQVAAVLLEEMKRCNLVQGENLFLESYIPQIF